MSGTYIYLEETRQSLKTQQLFHAALLRGDKDVMMHYETAADVEAAITRSKSFIDYYEQAIVDIKARIAEIEAGRLQDEPEYLPFYNTGEVAA